MGKLFVRPCALMRKPLAAVSAEEDANKLEFGPEFNEATCLLNSEVFVLLENQRQTKLATLTNATASSADRLFSNVFTKTHKYVEAFSRYKNNEMIREIRSCFTADLAEFEMAQLANLCPESTEEAKVLIPSLEGKISEEGLQQILDDMINARKFQY